MERGKHQARSVGLHLSMRRRELGKLGADPRESKVVGGVQIAMSTRFSFSVKLEGPDWHSFWNLQGE